MLTCFGYNTYKLHIHMSEVYNWAYCSFIPHSLTSSAIVNQPFAIVNAFKST